MRKHVPALVLCALSLAPGLNARAADAPVAYRPCDRKPSTADTDAARGLFQAGKVSYEEADYPRAISLWRDAYERDCTAVLLLKNLAGAYEKAGNLDAAIITLDTYIKRDPENSEIPTLQKRIENMRRARAAATTTATASATTTAPVPTVTTPPPPPTETAPATGGSRPILPLVVAGGGAVIGITGLVLYLVSKGSYDDHVAKVNKLDTREVDIKTKCRTSAVEGVSTECNKAADQNSPRVIGSVLAYSGIGIAVAGGVWYLLSKPEPTTSTSRRFTPNLAPGYAGFSYGGAF